MVAVDPRDGSTVIDPVQLSLNIFAEGHHTALCTFQALNRVCWAEISFQPTAEEMVVQHESIIVNAGTYKVRGSTVTVDPLIVKSPGFVGDLATSEPQMNRGMLSLITWPIVAAYGISAPNVAGF